MATLLVSAAVNIGVGLLVNFLFPAKGQDTSQEGPRLNDLTVTSSAYGQFINIGYGTERMGGNIIWSPGIDEIVNVSTQEVGGKGGGGGGSATTTTYSYFASFALAFSEGVGEDVLRIWGDGKLIFDKTGEGLATSKGIKFRFYPGDEDQLPDPLIEADKGVGNVPAHRGLCYLVAEQWPLVDFGNRIPQLTAEVTYDAVDTLPFSVLNELSGANMPGSLTGSDGSSHFFLDPFSDKMFTFKGAGDGVTLSHLGTMTMSATNTGGLSGSQRGSVLGLNGKAYTQRGGSNFVPFFEMDGDTLQDTGFSLGIDSIGGSTAFHFRNNSSFFGVLSVGAPELGVEPVDVYVVTSTHFDDVRVIYRDDTGTLVGEIFDLFSGSDGSHIMMDHHNGRLFFALEDTAELRLYEVTADLNVGALGVQVADPEVNLIGTYTKGGVDIAGTADLNGSCFVPDESALIMSNGSSMLKVNLDDGSILATNLSLGFRSLNQWTTSGLFAFGDGESGGAGDGEIRTIDVDDLSLVRTEDLGLAGFSDGGEANYPRSAYDPRSHSIIISRIHGTDPAQRVVRLLLQRGDGQGEPLSDIVADICTRAGLEQDEFDISDLVSETVRGYVINRFGSARSALEPLMQGFLFEGAESDWTMKFVRRGGAAALTIPEDDIGRLTSNSNEEFIEETRTQEVEMPETFGVLYADIDQDYQQGRQQDKRVSLPVPTQSARNAIDLDLPIVFNANEAKQLAQRWLYTSWAERLNFKSALPWKYIRLDPTDVFNVTYRGETRQLRMSDMEVGADLSLDFQATQEDARSNDSEVPAGGGLGLVPQNIPSNLPSRLHLLDLPLLVAADASLQTFSRAYWAASGYDDSWPGALLFQSKDGGGSFQEIGAVPTESAWGLINGTLPDPETTFTWDESTTVDVNVVRGVDRFQTSTDIEVLNGANALAVLRADGTPEIIQFVNVTQLDANTVRLSRLLRGRRGTEPLATDHTSGETVVLLEVGRTQRFQIELSQIDVPLTYKGVTLNTLIEDAPSQSYTFTGQDLLPYSMSPFTAVESGDDLEIEGTRRTRFNGELRDGLGEVPLNEGSEAYEIDIIERATGLVVRTISVTTPSAVYTAAEQAADGIGGEINVEGYQMSEIVGRGRVALLESVLVSGNDQLPLLNGGAEDGTDHWTTTTGALLADAALTGGLQPTEGGTAYFHGNASSQTIAHQDVALLPDWFASIDAGTAEVHLTWWHDTAIQTFNDKTRIILEFFDEDGASLGAPSASSYATETEWTAKSFDLAIPADARTVRISMDFNRDTGSSNDGKIDVIRAFIQTA